MSGGGGSTQTVQKSDPWAGVQPLLNQTYGMAGNALDQRLPYYPNQTYANFTPLQEMGMLGGLGYAQNQFAPQVSGLQGALGQYLNAPLNITQDPAVQNMMAANRGQVTDWLTRDALPSIGSGAVAAGQYGGSRQGIAEGLAVGEGARALADANAQTALGAYGDAGRLAAFAGNAMPGALQLGFQPTDYMQQVGGQYQGQYQRAIDDAIARYYYPEQSLWAALNNATGVASGAGGLGGTSTTTAPGSNRAAGALGGALSGAAVGNQILPGWGTAIGAGVGLLGGIF